MLADFEKRKKDVSTQAAGIVSAAKTEAQSAVDEAKKDVEERMERRLKAATEQIASAEQAKVMAEKMDPSKADDLMNKAIEDVRTRLH